MEPIYLTMHVFLVIIPAKHAPVVRTMIVYYANLSIFELLSVQFANVIWVITTIQPMDYVRIAILNA